ncbi:MAG TPA: LysM peptidoglycan-binding domain-containing protein [Nitrospira sp.]|nr:LysM peptidoglycan-binding domain-containing protein [Nitrospira sp.]
MNTPPQLYVSTFRMTFAVRLKYGMVTLLLVSLSGGCARLAPSAEPGPADLQVAADSLKRAAQEAQRTAADLRSELEGQRKDLADAQVARAQLQGMLRETERRLDEARQIIDLQREELASARVERERMAQTLGPHHSRFGRPAVAAPYQGKIAALSPDGVLLPAPVPREKVDAWPPVSSDESGPSAVPIEIETEQITDEPKAEPAPLREVIPAAPMRTVVIQNGDTLWRLSHRHRVSLEALRSLNGLSSNVIVTGRTLRLPEPRVHQISSQASLGTLAR